MRDLLRLLESFYASADHHLPTTRPLPADALPPTYRSLLAHDQDMTGTLEAFVGARLHVRAIAVRHSADTLEREVLLATDGDERPVEFGAIRIHLDRLGPEVRERVLEGVRPLGAILNDTATAYTCRPAAYFSLPSDPVTESAFEITGPHVLYGRHNIIHDPEGGVIAEVVEILPPLEGAPSSPEDIA